MSQPATRELRVVIIGRGFAGWLACLFIHVAFRPGDAPGRGLAGP